jgi:predicted Zn-dependent protease with MMP-like domain
VNEESFADLVEEALETLPRDFRTRLQNVEVLVQDEPSREQLRGARVPPGHTLFGLYQGVPLTQRGMTPPLFPDRITLFRGPLERYCATPEAIREQVRRTVLHEIAHFFGISDDRLRELDAY